MMHDDYVAETKITNFFFEIYKIFSDFFPFLQNKLMIILQKFFRGYHIIFWNTFSVNYKIATLMRPYI